MDLILHLYSLAVQSKPRNFIGAVCHFNKFNKFQLLSLENLSSKACSTFCLSSEKSEINNISNKTVTL